MSITLLVLTALLLGVLKFSNILLKLLTACVALICVGLLLASFRAHSVGAPVLSEPYFGAVEGRVVKLDRSQSNRLRITLDRLTLYGLEPEQTPERVRITLPTKKAYAQTGARVLIYARLDGPGAPVEPGGFDFRRWAWFHKLGGVGYALGPLLPSAQMAQSSLMMEITNTRHWLADLIRDRIPEENGAFAAAILTGDRSAIDPAQLKDLRASNLAHLLAISGLHMGLLTGFTFGLFRYGVAAIPNLALKINAKKVGAAVAIPVGLLYLVISGASIATQRAYIMVLVVLIAVLLDRPAFTLRAVALAALIVIIIAPESVTQVGFQMSFAATIGLVAGFEALRHTQFWRRPVVGWRKFAKSVFSVAFSSAVAGAATAPFAAFHFNQFAQYGLLANLFAVPLMGFVVMPAALSALILTPLGIAAPFYWLAGAGIGLILSIAKTVAGLDGSVVLVPSGNAIALPVFAFGCLIGVLWIGRFKLAGALVAVLGLMIWVGSERPSILIDEKGKLVGEMTAKGRVLNKVKGDSFTANSWLENDGDAASQFDAGSRHIGSSQLVHIKEPDGRDPSSYCKTHRIVLSPKLDAKLKTDCLVIDADMLSKEGAIAIYIKEGELKIRGSRTSAGARLWTTQ